MLIFLGDNAHPADLFDAPTWAQLRIGETRDGLALAKSGDKLVIAFNGAIQTLCYDAKGSTDFPNLILKVSPPSAQGFVVAMCATEGEGLAASVTDLKSRRTVARISRAYTIFPWVSWSPDGNFALLSLKTDEDNDALIAIDLRSGKGKVLKGTHGILQNADASDWLLPEVVWLNNQVFKYRVPRECTDDECSMPVPYEIQVSLASGQIVRKPLR